MSVMRLEAAVDVGGTFTDGVLLDTATDKILVAKALTTPSNPGDAIVTVLDDLLRQAREHFGPGALRAVKRIVHGTTLITNTLIERRGGRTALVVTRGTRDVLDISRELRYDTYDLTIEYPAPLVPPDCRYELTNGWGRTERSGASLPRRRSRG